MSELAFSFEVITPLNSVVLSGSELNGGVKLVWNTIGEKDTKSFDVLRKNADGDFVKIGNVVSKENGDNSYSFFESNALLGNNYYKLKNNDINGNSTYSNIAFVKVAALENAISIYPNPSTNGVVNVVSNKAIGSISIYSASTGIKHISKNYNSLSENVQIDIQSLPKGIYVVEITSSLSIVRKKLIVN